MNREILYHASIQREIREVLEYYGSLSPQLADDFWDELNRAFQQVRKFPERCHFDPSGWRRYNLKRYPYHFLFRHNTSQVKVIVVRHDSRDPNYGSGRK